MRKSYLKIDATLEVILFALQYFKNMPIGTVGCAKYLNQYSNIKLRMKLLINDVYGYMIKNEGFESGISDGVQIEINTNSKTSWIWEHTIPWDVFFFSLVKKNFTTPADLYDYLKKTFCPCWITSVENKRLDAAGLQRKMPLGWKSWIDRYNAPKVPITLYKKPKNPSNRQLKITKRLLCL